MASSEKDDLSLKVMRLSQPSWDLHYWPLISVDEITNPPAVDSPGEHVPVELALDSSTALLLPQAQGRIYCGETFSAYVNLANTCSVDVTDVVLKVELVMGQQRSFLFDNAAEPVVHLAANASFDCTAMHQLNETGIYMLICSVSYKGSSGEPRSFKKSFKFAAECPFSITHRVVKLKEKIMAECVLKNVSPNPVFLTEASIFCADGLKAKSLENTSRPATENYNGVHYFGPEDIFSLIFALNPFSTVLDATLAQRSQTLGTLVLQWRTASGGNGSLTDYVISYDVEQPMPLELRVVGCPSTVRVDRPFRLDIEVINRMETVVNPVLHISRHQLEPLFVQGPVEEGLGKLEALSSKKYSFEIFCLQPGFHSIRGIEVYDAETQRRTACSPLCDILAL